MNIAEKMKLEDNLRENLAKWMLQHGDVLEDEAWRDQYAEFIRTQVIWRKQTYNIIVVDGLVCRIEKVNQI